MTPAGDSLLSHEAQASISQGILGASKHTDQNAMHSMALVLFLLGTSYRGSRRSKTSTKNMQREKKKKERSTVPTNNPQSSVLYCSLTKIYITEEPDILCGFECQDHFSFEIFDIGSFNVVAPYILIASIVTGI